MTTLGDVAKTVGPTKTPRESERYVGLEHLDSGSPRIARWGTTDNVLSPTTAFSPGDVLFSKLRPYLRKVAVADFDGRCTTEALVYRPTVRRLDAGYLGLLLQSEAAITHADASSIGSRMPRTSTKIMDSFEVALPPLHAQQRIVDLIGALDGTFAATENALGLSRQVARELRQTAFRRAAADAFSVSAGTIFDMLLGRQKSVRQSTGAHVIPYLRAANISSDGFLLDDVQTMNFSPAEQEKYCIQAGDVMLIEGGVTLGRSSLWKAQIAGPIGFDKHVIRLRAVAGRSLPEYALQWTKWAYESGAFNAVATGVTIRALGFGRASGMSVPDLPIHQQHELVGPLMAADEVISLLRQSVMRLHALRSNLLAALLSGEHEIPESYDELIEEAS